MKAHLSRIRIDDTATFKRAALLASVKPEVCHRLLKMEPTASVLSSTAAKILVNADTLAAYFRRENLPEPGFETEGRIEYEKILKDPGVARARKVLINEARKLLLYALSPRESFQM